MLENLRNKIAQKLAKLSDLKMERDFVSISNESFTLGVPEGGEPIDYTNLTVTENIAGIELKMVSVSEFPVELYEDLTQQQIQETRNEMKSKAKELGCETKEMSSRLDILCSKQVTIPREDISNIEDTLYRMHKELEKKLDQI